MQGLYQGKQIHPSVSEGLRSIRRILRGCHHGNLQAFLHFLKHLRHISPRNSLGRDLPKRREVMAYNENLQRRVFFQPTALLGTQRRRGAHFQRKSQPLAKKVIIGLFGNPLHGSAANRRKFRPILPNSHVKFSQEIQGGVLHMPDSELREKRIPQKVLQNLPLIHIPRGISSGKRPQSFERRGNVEKRILRIEGFKHFGGAVSGNHRKRPG